ncbi:transposase [Micromonospora sp. RHAY321]|uniref:transposase n=1 Tax=Micromonospora sp. RHAY321 TaxID=2944807 RepID=UPI0035B36CE0
MRAGAAWRDVPARYGSWQSIYTRFRRWALDGTFERMRAGSRSTLTPPGTSTGWCRSTRPSCALTSTPRALKEGRETDEPQDHALGRGRGRLTVADGPGGDRRGEGSVSGLPCIDADRFVSPRGAGSWSVGRDSNPTRSAMTSASVVVTSSSSPKRSPPARLA